MGLRDHWHGAEVEGGERLGRIKMRLGPMPLNASFGALSQLVLKQRAEQSRGLPAFLVRTLGELGPQPADCWQTQLVEHQGQAATIMCGRVHAATSSSSS